MSKKTITVTIKGGTATVETKGFAGKACIDATAELEKAMGTKTADTKLPEYDFKEVQQAGR